MISKKVIMMCGKRFITLLLGMLVWHPSIIAITYGSDTAVAVVTANQAIASNDPTNQIIGFSAFVGGITLPNATTACRYNNYFPFYGPLVFNGGLLNLNRNLTLGSNVTITTGAQINGNSFGLNFPVSSSAFTISSPMVLGNLTLTINSPITLTSILTFTNTCVIEGNGNIIDCTAGALTVGTGSSLLIQNATLKGLSNNRFYCYDNTGTFSLEGVTCILNNTLTFSHGGLEFYGSNLLTGTQILLYQSSRLLKIHSNATCAFDYGMTFSYAAPSNNLLTFDDVTAKLALYQTTLYANTPGLLLTNGTISINGLCPLINDAASSANGIAIGNGISSANNIMLNVLAESGLAITRGFFVDNNV